MYLGTQNSLYRLWKFLETHFLEEHERVGSSQQNVIQPGAGCIVLSRIQGPGISCENTLRTPREISSAGIFFVVIVIFNACFFLCEAGQDKLNSVKEYWPLDLNCKQEVVKFLN